MDDLISRRAAIDAVKDHATSIEKKYCEKYGCAMSEFFEGYKLAHKHLVELINRLPTADPGLDEWCTDCKEYDKERHSCPRWNRVIRETLKDARKENGEV